MSEDILQLLLSEKAVAVYEVITILALVVVLILQVGRNRKRQERRQINNKKMRNAELEKILKNQDIRENQSPKPNPFEVLYKHNADNPLPRHQIGIEVHSDISVQKYLFDLNQELTIGRDEKNILPLNDKMIPERSCSIYLKNRDVYVKGIDVRNPAVLQRGKQKLRLQNNRSVKLENKDILILGRVSLHIALYDR